MAFESIEFEVSEKCRFWKGDEEGEYLEGNICEEIEDGYGNRQFVVDRGTNEFGESIHTTLPTNRSVRNYYKNLMIGDYVKVVFVETRPPFKEGMQPQKIFRIQKDPSRFKKY